MTGGQICYRLLSMNAREALIAEIQHQPESLVKELQHYLDFLVEKHGGEQDDGMDLSPLDLLEVRRADLHLRFKRILILAPVADETGTLLCARNEMFGLDVSASNRAELMEELRDQIALVWREYARAMPEPLTPGAQQLRANLLEHIERLARWRANAA